MKKHTAVGLAAGTLVAGGLVAARIVAQRRVAHLWRSLETPSVDQRFDPEMVRRLPEPARRYLLHAIQPGTRLATSVLMAMTGSIRLARDAKPIPMASEQITAPPLGYIWKARAGRGAFRFSGFDLCAEGRAEMRWWMGGVVPVVRAGGADVSRAAIGRLLGESIFVPSVLLVSGARWEPVDGSSARVHLSSHGEEVALTLEVNEDGSLRRCTFPRWNGDPKIGPVGYLPFVTERCSAERTFNGYTIPTRFESGWCLGEPNELRFFFGHIEHAEYML